MFCVWWPGSAPAPADHTERRPLRYPGPRRPGVRLRHFFHCRRGALGILNLPSAGSGSGTGCTAGTAADGCKRSELSASVEVLTSTPMIDRDRQLANDRQAGVLQQIVDVVDPAGAGVFNRHHRVIGLAGFYLIKNIGELRAAALNKLLKVASGVLTRRQMRVRALGPRNATRAECGLILFRCCCSRVCWVRTESSIISWNRRVI
ncbi:Uncharacterised protein [Klebsiella pneumoniae]|nr:Uncharacterised protein [Klebsiella pneumoniae]